MKTPQDIILALESTNSRLEKESILRQATKMKNLDFFRGAQLAMDGFITFGIRQIPISDNSGRGLSMANFMELVEKLTSRKITGNAAKDAVAEAMESATQDQWNLWYRRILIKDLRCGIHKTFNKIVKDFDKSFLIPERNPMLATDASNADTSTFGKCYIEYKYDGVRAVVTVIDGKATIRSRQGKVLANFPHIEKALSHPAYNNLVFDAEVMSEDFQALMKQVSRKTEVDTTDAYLAVFDCIDLAEFKTGVSTETQIERKEYLDRLKPEFDSCIKVVKYQVVDFSTPAGQKKYAKINKFAIDNGYEGIMIKDIHAVYSTKRTKAWKKVKPSIEVTLTVTAVEKGAGKYANTTGALTCEGIDTGKMIKVNVGSGLSDELRDDIWKSQESVIGQLVEIKADVITQSQDGTYSLRFPRFKTFRGFAAGEKI